MGGVSEMDCLAFQLHVMDSRRMAVAIEEIDAIDVINFQLHVMDSEV